MFNIFEGNKDAKERKLQERLKLLKRARENYFWVTPERVPVPEIVADGHGPDDRHPPVFAQDQDPPHRASHSNGTEFNDPASPFCMPRTEREGERCPNPGGNVAIPTHKYYTSQPCNLCGQYTRQISYGPDRLIWHCTACCTCDFCMAEVEQQQQQLGYRPVTDTRVGQEQVAAGHEALHDALKTPVDQLFFCTKCGAGLRCGVCNNTGTGRYCDLCGKKDTGEGFCTDCWKEEDTDG